MYGTHRYAHRMVPWTRVFPNTQMYTMLLWHVCVCPRWSIRFSWWVVLCTHYATHTNMGSAWVSGGLFDIDHWRIRPFWGPICGDFHILHPKITSFWKAFNYKMTHFGRVKITPFWGQIPVSAVFARARVLGENTYIAS